MSNDIASFGSVKLSLWWGALATNNDNVMSKSRIEAVQGERVDVDEAGAEVKNDEE